jgi:hypothetical protein
MACHRGHGPTIDSGSLDLFGRDVAVELTAPNSSTINGKARRRGNLMKHIRNYNSHSILAIRDPLPTYRLVYCRLRLSFPPALDMMTTRGDR